jgi:transmembrane sensor
MVRLFLSRQERIRREAADWFARLHGPQGEDHEGAARRWAGLDPAHAAALDRFDRHWRAAGSLGQRREEPVPAAPRAREPRLALAAGLAAVIGLSALFAAAGLPPFAEAGRAQALSFETGIGEIRRVGLADGLVMTLDTLSRVKAEVAGGRRLLRLDRGRLRIEAGRGGPPLILLGGRRVDLLEVGQLDVMAEPGRLAIAAIRGGLSFRLEGGPVRRLGPGEGLQLGAGAGQPGAVRPLDAQWASGAFEFAGAPVGEVIGLANRYGRSRLVLGDPRLAAERVTGRFRAGDIDGLSASLAAALDLRVTAGPRGEIRLDRKRPISRS